MKRKIKIVDKKRFVISCVFVLMVIILVTKLFGLIINSAKGQAVLNNVALAADKDGSIIVEENEFYKRYTINCKKNMEKIISDEKDDFFEVAVMNEAIDNVNIKSEGKAQDKDISYDKNENRVIIKFKKKFKDNNYIYLDNESKKKIIVLLSKKEKPYNHVAVLDPGHGGADKGTNLKNLYEKDITLKIVNYAEKELIYKGCKIIKTRNEDKFVPLQTIGNITNSAKAEAFISVHINSNKESKYNGVTTYYYYNTKEEQKGERMALANAMQKELLKSDNWYDRGLLKNNYAVLRYSNIPAVLLECGFMSNEGDRDKLSKEEVLKNFGNNISNGLLNYLNSENNKGIEYYNKSNTQKNSDTEKNNNDKTVTPEI
jgi:N-acetylmuramoyl-L-alanine amidase